MWLLSVRYLLYISLPIDVTQTIFMEREYFEKIMHKFVITRELRLHTRESPSLILFSLSLCYARFVSLIQICGHKTLYYYYEMFLMTLLKPKYDGRIVGALLECDVPPSTV